MLDMKPLFLVFIILLTACSSSSNKVEDKRYTELSQRVTIIRDIWGIPHIYGKTDADAVFGLMYVQCEESFERSKVR